MEGGLLLRSTSVAGPCVEEDDDELATVELPPGFRFHPTDEEIIMHYLLNKVIDRRFRARAIAEADLNKCEPWDLPKKAKEGEKEWFFYFQRDRKYPTGMRTNRATESGYWKATGKDKEIHYNSKNCLVGMKKTLVFYKGRAPKGDKTNWVMHEYRLEGNFSSYNISRPAKEEFVVCRVFHKNSGIRKIPVGLELARIDSFVDRLLDIPTLPPLVEYNCSSINEQDGSRAFLSNHKLQYLQYEPKHFFIPQNINIPFSNPRDIVESPKLYPQITLPTPVVSYEAQTSFGYQNHELGYPPNVFHLKAPKMEHFSSNNDSFISHSQETGHIMENMASEITSFRSNGDNESRVNKLFDDHELEGLGFSPDISDLDSFWSY
ncbi:hypothetical protein CASFOL_026861 [Castilleja foliolosa]|uniref:NAC domain-containing protein n=1 Tax=Castilleja foliolosa TaxID=1961234 RepID=A0ABD3CJA4_9LAMI